VGQVAERCESAYIGLTVAGEQTDSLLAQIRDKVRTWRETRPRRRSDTAHVIII
jgi:hypothetical protein